MKHKQKILFFILILIFIPSTLGFGVSTFYTQNTPLNMYPGESKEVYLELQNGGGATSNIILRADPLVSDIAVITDTNSDYLIQPDERVKVNIKVDIPADAAIGQIYEPTVTFTEIVDSSTSGAVSTAGRISGKIYIIVAPKPEPKPQTQVQAPVQKQSNNGLLLFVGLIIILAIILGVYSFKRKNDTAAQETSQPQSTPPSQEEQPQQTTPHAEVKKETKKK